jgi:hypothetical protein
MKNVILVVSSDVFMKAAKQPSYLPGSVCHMARQYLVDPQKDKNRYFWVFDDIAEAIIKLLREETNLNRVRSSVPEELLCVHALMKSFPDIQLFLFPSGGTPIFMAAAEVMQKVLAGIGVFCRLVPTSTPSQAVQMVGNIVGDRVGVEVAFEISTAPPKLAWEIGKAGFPIC